MYMCKSVYVLTLCGRRKHIIQRMHENMQAHNTDVHRIIEDIRCVMGICVHQLSLFQGLKLFNNYHIKVTYKGSTIVFMYTVYYSNELILYARYTATIWTCVHLYSMHVVHMFAFLRCTSSNCSFFKR